ncbi:alpha-amylase family glycosyl hydrolase [Faecalimonas sp.]
MKQCKGIPFPLGVTVKEDCANFSTTVQNAKECFLLLYKKGEITPTFEIEMQENRAFGEIRSIIIKGMDWAQWEYNYKIDGNIVTDIYAKAITGKEEWLGETSTLVKGKILMDSYDWERDEPLLIPENEVVAYSLHVRGFTKHKSSKVKHGGTFLGVKEKLSYLKKMGINQIHCMPIYEFEEKGRYTNYWGYGPAFYFAPKSSYAATKDAVCELKDLVKACHKNGIEMILDLPFTPSVPKQMMIDCIRYYKIEYHIDGFIVNPFHAPFKELQEDPLLKNTKILKKQDDFQNTMRRFLKGDEGMIKSVMWWTRHISKEEGIFNYITTHTGFTLADLVSYDGKHNEKNGEKNQDGPDYNYSWNCGAEGPSRKKTVIALRKKQIRNAFLLLLTSQGMPCILAGDEFRNSQNGNNNVYCQDNEIGWINWGNSEKDRELLCFVRELICFRKEHKVLHLPVELQGIDSVSCGIPDVSYHGEAAWQIPSQISSRQLGIYYCGEGMGENSCFIAYNMHWLKHSFALPALKNGKKWYRAVSTDMGVLESMELLDDQRKVMIGDRTIEIFVGKV